MISTVFSYRADWNELIGMIHHCYKKIEKHNYVDDWEAPKHDETPEPGEFLDTRKFKVVQVYQTKSCPE